MAFSPRLLAASVALAWYSILWSLGLLGWRTARKRYRNRPRSPLAVSSPEEVPGVSILRPLKGLDANLFENLESSFTQDYPKFEILLSVSNENDRAIPVVEELISKYPNVDATLIIGDGLNGVNPKINNLIRPYQQAKYDIIWVMDSNVQVHHGALGRAVSVLDPAESAFIPSKPGQRRIGLVHHVPLGFATENLLGARIEEAFLNTNHAKMYLAINRVAVDSCVVGKSNMYRRSDVDRLTATLRPQSEVTTYSGNYGLAAFSNYLAEDNMIGLALWHELGLRHDLSCDVARNAIGDMDLKTYVWRRVRWIRVRKQMVLAATLIEPFTESVVVGLLAGWAIYYLFRVPSWLFLILHFTAWIAVDLDVYATLSGEPRPSAGLLPFLKAWICREIIALPIWLLAIFGNEVDWRGRRYRILRNGLAQKVEG
ncbi:glycosyltransferase family 21 protein [Sphaerobolus stellatus SS14]|uniref:Ceramide glucosyltransferase n=1 Tax=Sphaerobolus stellatus (strain SS14) TaxID=990650 RepID=A0A0C9U7I4_SPHS4|nr:glycosyltransferase family 21 protein [Sphaerobolus stellatus SS14]